MFQAAILEIHGSREWIHIRIRFWNPGGAPTVTGPPGVHSSPTQKKKGGWTPPKKQVGPKSTVGPQLKYGQRNI